MLKNWIIHKEPPQPARLGGCRAGERKVSRGHHRERRVRCGFYPAEDTNA